MAVESHDKKLDDQKATITRLETNRDATINRFYYLDIKKCLDPEIDSLDAIISVSKKNKEHLTNQYLRITEIVFVALDNNEDNHYKVTPLATKQVILPKN